LNKLATRSGNDVNNVLYDIDHDQVWYENHTKDADFARGRYMVAPESQYFVEGLKHVDGI
jgi:hypothetical protein